jgi:hypothetical protein
MESRSSHIYEIEFDVLGQWHDEYDLWLQRDALNWFAHESVDGFEVHYDTAKRSSRIRFVFEFDSRKRWEEFADSAKTALSIDRLESFSTDVEKTLWQRDSVSLSGQNDSSTEEPTMTVQQKTRPHSWYQN